MIDRRQLLITTAACMPLQPALADATAPAALRAGGCVVAFRHALAPGSFDPPGMRLDDCRTQRNLNDEGRAQARRIGEWFRQHGLVPAQVRTSPWCRCRDTAQLAFGDARTWPALGSPRGATEAVNATSLAELRQAVQAATRRRGAFEAWVTHMFVLQALVGGGAASGEGLVLQAAADGQVVVRARIVTA